MVPTAIGAGKAAEPLRGSADGKREAGHGGRHGQLRPAPFAAELAAKGASLARAAERRDGRLGLGGETDASVREPGIADILRDPAAPEEAVDAACFAAEADPAAGVGSGAPSDRLDTGAPRPSRRVRDREPADGGDRTALSPTTSAPATLVAFFGLRAVIGASAPEAPPEAAPRAGSDMPDGVASGEKPAAGGQVAAVRLSAREAGLVVDADAAGTGGARDLGEGRDKPAGSTPERRPSAAPSNFPDTSGRPATANRATMPEPGAAWRQSASPAPATPSRDVPADARAQRLVSTLAVAPRRQPSETSGRAGSTAPPETRSAVDGAPVGPSPLTATAGHVASERDRDPGGDRRPSDGKAGEPITATVTKSETHLAPTSLAASPAAQVVAALSDSLRQGMAATPAPATSAPPPASTAVLPGPSRPDAARTLQLALNPLDLGAVTLTLHLAGGTLRLHVAAEKAATAALFGQDGRHLARALGEAGYDLGSLSVVVDSVPAGSAASSASGQSPSGQSQAGQGDPGAGAARDNSATGGRSDFGARSESGRSEGGRSGGQGTGAGDSGRSGQTRKDLADAGDLPHGRAGGGVYV